VRRYLADPRCPHRSGPWTARQVEELRTWAAEFLQEDRSGKASGRDDDEAFNLSRAEKQVNIQLKLQRKRKVEAECSVLEKKYVKRDEHELAHAKKFEAIKKSLQQVAKALRQRLADETDPGRVEEILSTALRAVMNSGFGGNDAGG
jgi:hypothetical protein